MLKKTMEKMHVMLMAMYEDRQRQPGGSELTGINTGKRKIRIEQISEGEVDSGEGDTSMSVDTEAGQD